MAFEEGPMMKEDAMKIRRKAILGIGLLGVCLGSVAPVVQATHLFPEPQGMSGQITAQQVNIRQYPDSQGKVVAQVNQVAIQVIGKSDDWYQVWYEGEKQWIHQMYVAVEKEEWIPDVQVDGERVVAYGMAFIGTPYVWGGSNLNTGVDCSGFTQEVFGAFDIDISRVSYMQAEDGPSIDKTHLKCGDLVFFDTQGVNDGHVSHVGIYAGENQFLHSDGTHGVMMSDLNNPYYLKNYVKSIRIL